MFQQPKLCPAEPVKFKVILFSRPSSPKFSAMNPEIDAPTDLSLFVILNFKVFDLFERILFFAFAQISLFSWPLSQGLFLFELQK